MKEFRLEDYPEPVTCAVPKGGVMLMKPLILHASNKSTSERNRRVIHLEFSDIDLPDGLDWREIFTPASPHATPPTTSLLPAYPRANDRTK
jgi:hypothetical protein